MSQLTISIHPVAPSYLLKRVQVTRDGGLVSGVLRHHRTERTDPSPSAYERHEPAGVPNQLHQSNQMKRRTGGEHATIHLLLARRCRRRVASGHDLGAVGEVGAVSGDRIGPEEQERSAKRAGVERDVPRRSLPHLPTLVHNLRRQTTTKIVTTRAGERTAACNLGSVGT